MFDIEAAPSPWRGALEGWDAARSGQPMRAGLPGDMAWSILAVFHQPALDSLLCGTTADPSIALGQNEGESALGGGMSLGGGHRDRRTRSAPTGFRLAPGQAGNIYRSPLPSGHPSLYLSLSISCCRDRNIGGRARGRRN